MMADDETIMPSTTTLSEIQYNVLVSVVWISSSLSIIGSSSIALIASKRFSQSFYHRIVFMLSFVDIIVSIACVLQPILIPPVDPMYHFAVGNTTTCSILGFLMRFPLAVATYNCYLSLYFNYSVRKGWREDSISSMPSLRILLEVIAHCIAFGMPIIFGTIGVITDSYNPLPLLHVCETGPWPPGCDKSSSSSSNSNNPDDHVGDDECTRGESYLIQDWFYISMLLLVSVVGIWNTASLYVFVRRQSATTKKRRNNNPSYKRHTTTTTSSTGISSRQQQRHNNNGQQHRRGGKSTTTAAKDYSTVGQVAHQSILYTLAYLNFFLWATVTRIVYDTVDVQGREDEPKYYIFVLLSYAFFPLQGFWNSYIYIRPRFNAWRRIHPDKPLIWVVRKIFSAEDQVQQSRRSNLRRTPNSGRRINSIRGGRNNERRGSLDSIPNSNIFQKSIDSLSMSLRSGKPQSVEFNVLSTTTNSTKKVGGEGLRTIFGLISPPKSMELSSSTPSAIEETDSKIGIASSPPSSSNETTTDAVVENNNHHFQSLCIQANEINLDEQRNQSCPSQTDNLECLEEVDHHNENINSSEEIAVEADDDVHITDTNCFHGITPLDEDSIVTENEGESQGWESCSSDSVCDA